MTSPATPAAPPTDGPPPGDPRRSRQGSLRAPGRRLLVLGTFVLLLLVLTVGGPALAGLLLPTGRDAPFRPPGGAHPLGTDALGADVAAQLLSGAPHTFAVPALAALVLAALGTVLGVVLGLGPARVRRAALRAGDVLLVVPPLVIVLVVVLGFGATPGSITAAVVLSGVVLLVRVLSSATRQVARAGYVEVALGFGDAPLRVALRDVAPRLAHFVVAEALLRFLGTVQLVAALGFLGFTAGLGDGWARAIRDNLLGFPLNPWATLAPGTALVLSMALLAIVVEWLGDGGRRAGVIRARAGVDHGTHP